MSIEEGTISNMWEMAAIVKLPKARGLRAKYHIGSTSLREMINVAGF